MSSSEGELQPGSAAAEITVVTGDRYRVEGDVKHVEQIIVDAARGSIMQFARFTEADTRDNLAVNPEHVVLVRAAGS